MSLSALALLIATTGGGDRTSLLTEPIPTASLSVQGLSDHRTYPGVRVVRGVLAFRDFAAFEETSSWLQGQSREEADAWESSLGFVSQRSLFDQVVDAEYQLYMAPYEHLPAEGLVSLTPPSGHSDVYWRCLANGVIKETDDTYDYAIAIPSMARIVDEGGFFIVENSLCQLKGPYLKWWIGATIDQAQDLDAATETDEALGLCVTNEDAPSNDDHPNSALWPPWWSIFWTHSHPNPKNGPPPSSGLPCGGFDRNTGWLYGGSSSRRGLLRVVFSRTWWWPYPYTRVTTSYYINVQSQMKNFWGNWVYPNCPNEVWIDGSWTAELRLIFLSNLAYAGSQYSANSYSYPHPNCINNFWGSFDPVSGANVPFGTTETYTAPAGYGFDEMCITPMHWHASVPGGSSGISMDIYN